MCTLKQGTENMLYKKKKKSTNSKTQKEDRFFLGPSDLLFEWQEHQSPEAVPGIAWDRQKTTEQKNKK